MDRYLADHYDRAVMIQDRVPLHADYSTKRHIRHRHHTDELMMLLSHQYLHLMVELMNYKIAMSGCFQTVAMMMMYNQDYVNDLIEFDRMDADVIHLEMVVESTVVENQRHLNSTKMVLAAMMFD